MIRPPVIASGEFDAFWGADPEMWATQPNYTKDQLCAIIVPTVIFVGEHDEAVEPAHTAEMAALIPNAEIFFMGHSLFRACPAKSR